MAETKKMTKKDFFGEIIEMATENGRVDIVEFATHEIELLAKKNASGSMSKTQKENIEIKNVIVEIMRGLDTKVRIADLAKVEELSVYSPNKISALVTQLKNEGRVNRTEEKGVAYFEIAI